MREYYRIANHYIALDAEENSALWNSLPNYAPFAVEAPEVTAKILTSLEIVEELPAGEGNILFDSAEPGFPRLLIKRAKSPLLPPSLQMPTSPGQSLNSLVARSGQCVLQ